MTRSRRLTAPVLLAALLATAACSGGGSPTAPSEAMPAAAVTSIAPTVSMRSSTSASDDVTAADIAAIDAPATEDVPDPSGDAAGVDAYGWTLTGFYHGKLKGYKQGGLGDTESSGYLAMHVKADAGSYTGTGEATEYGTGDTLSFTLSGSITSYAPHGEAVSMTAVAGGCPASGSARRYPHLFEGVLYSQGCGANAVPITYYFKVRPNKA